jgi:hypothetical protein|tara:strand:- start:53 stop:223 length:171 start_codon:yes stop_codon:yes gene_type:complete
MTYYHVAEYNAACQLIEFKDGKWVVEFTKPNGEVVVEKVDNDKISSLNCYGQESSY